MRRLKRFMLATAIGVAAAACGSGSPYASSFEAIGFMTTTAPAAGAGQFYDVLLQVEAKGGALPADNVAVETGVLPPGIRLMAEMDAAGKRTGNARLVGFARQTGSYAFTIKAISTGGKEAPAQPDVVARQAFSIVVSAGRVAILSPTAAEGTVDPAIPAVPETIPFVNPANPQAFYSFAWEIAGGSGSKINTVYLPRELELSTFDEAMANLAEDTIEEGEKFSPNFADGGWFALQAGADRVQVGGFQAPRGPVGTVKNLDAEWFQPDAVAKSSRRDFANTDGFGSSGDTTLGTPRGVVFSDYFDPAFRGTDPESTPRAKYPFAAGEYQNAFFVGFTAGVDLTPLRYRVIVESIDTNGTPTDRSDDVIARKAYIVQVTIPEIRLDTLALPPATAGVDYDFVVGASGGVPPLSFDLEYIDGVPGDGITANTAGSLTKALFGLEVDVATGQFFGVPRATGSVDVTVRAYADVMNPIQGGAATIPTGGAFEFDGTLPVTGKKGRHITLTLEVAPPATLQVANKTLKGGVDGFPYPGDRLTGFGGVPTLIPDPIGFAGDYPADAVRSYAFSAEYTLDNSHANPGTIDQTRALPNALVLDGDRFSPTNGVISGVAYDRGFHDVTVFITDAYLGDAAAPNVGDATTASRMLNLSVGPDKAVYMRGVQKAEGTGEPTGLLDATAAMGEPLMVPMFLEAGIFTGGTGLAPKLYSPTDVPANIDILPVMLANGGSDLHVDKSEPTISGYWPAESNKVSGWTYYYYGSADSAWKHLQQEHTWIQTPTPEHLRVYLWGETKIKSFLSGSGTTVDYKKYQQFDLTGKRGVMVQNPITGEIWMPAILDNAKDDDDGATFGAEYVSSCAGTNPADSNFGYVYDGYERYYKYASYMRGTREARLQGLGSYLEPNQNASNGRMTQGRTAVSVAMSADGTWGATALPGGDTQMFLLWRTDKQPIPQAMLNQPFVTPLSGKDASGGTLANSACIVRLGGETASGKFISDNPRYLLPDSMTFVRDGVIFLMENHLDYVFGFSLVDGHLSSKSVNARITPNGQGPAANAVRGQYVPDQDYLRAMCQTDGYSVQFAFTGNKPATGEEGPDKVAFIAGDNLRTYSFNDYNATYTNLGTDFSGNMRRGYAVSGNANKALLFLDMTTGATGLDLGGSTLTDLTGNSSLIYGDLLTPGRPGEELDFLSVSPDGKYVAVVRDYYVGGPYQYTYYGINPTFGTLTTSTTQATSYYQTSDDLLVISTEGVDMDSGTSGVQTVLFLGSGNNTSSFTGTPSANSVSYASAAPWVNASGRRINSLMFSEDSKTLLFRYAGSNTYHPKYFGSAYQYGINSITSGTFVQSTAYQSLSSQHTLRFHFRTSSDGPIDFRSTSAAGSFLKNNLEGLTTVKSGDTTAPFTLSHNDTENQFWATFKSPNGKFLYMVSDQVNGPNFLVGFNISAEEINGHKPFEPFSPHAATVGFEQLDVNSFNYEGRFAAAPDGQTAPSSGRTGGGIIFATASDATAGPTSATDLEVYAFDADIGGDMVALTSAVTNGTNNAINHLTVSADGNILIGQRAETGGNSNTSRTTLNSDTDLFAVTNVHEAILGGTPEAFFISENMSHGATLAFVGEGKGPQALFFSSAAKGADNKTWAERTLKVALLQAGAAATVVDSTKSHYVVLSGGRITDDDAGSGN